MKFIITCDVVKARGFQQWTVEAESEMEALAKHEAGESDFEGEEVEVTDLGIPRITKGE